MFHNTLIIQTDTEKLKLVIRKGVYLMSLQIAHLKAHIGSVLQF
jgi:hypothetical protein